MTILNGIKDGVYLAQFLGKKIAIRIDKNLYAIYPHLTAIFAGKLVQVSDKNGDAYYFPWDMCENPYVMLQEDMEIEFK